MVVSGDGAYRLTRSIAQTGTRIAFLTFITVGLALVAASLPFAAFYVAGAVAAWKFGVRSFALLAALVTLSWSLFYLKAMGPLTASTSAGEPRQGAW